ncbi:MAG: putative DNA binding domain-containing protein [Myxococcales bacterium]|nr:putative DNA binding domain-containing protein [Myxococcales bacterium]
MLSPEQLDALAHDLESHRVERKASFKAVKSDVEEAICAFSNDLAGEGKPGVVIIGADDLSGAPTGLQVTDELLRQLSDIRSAGNILPPPMMTVYRATLDGQHVVVVEVEPSLDPPVRLRGRVCIRVGPRRGTATRDEERILNERRRAGDRPFDARTVRGTTLDDVNLDRWRQEYLPLAVDEDTLIENDRPLGHQLASLHLTGDDGLPSATLILTYGREPRRFLPGAYVQFVRYDGTTETDAVIDHKELNGTVPDVLRALHELMRINVRRELDPNAVSHIERDDYPLPALQQIAGNALMHRSYEVWAPVRVYWYSDRVEIESPGGLYGRVNEANFGERGATDYRNPTLAAALKVLGFVQSFGMGIPIARKRCADNGNPPPEFKFSPSHVLCIVRAPA